MLRNWLMAMAADRSCPATSPIASMTESSTVKASYQSPPTSAALGLGW